MTNIPAPPLPAAGPAAPGPGPFRPISALPAWPTALGLFSIFMGAQLLLGCVTGALSLFAYHSAGPGGGFLIAQFFRSAAAFLSAGLVLPGGICLLKRVPVARGLLLAYAIVAVAGALLGVAAQALAFTRFGSDLGFYSSALASVVGQVPSLLPPYPIFCLVWFFRRSVADEMAAWR